MKIFDRVLLKEYTTTTVVLFLSLLGIVLATQLVRHLGQASSGQIQVDTIFIFVFLALLRYTPTLITLSFFLGVTLTLVRAYHHSEMVIWFSSGRPITAWLSPLLRLVIPLALVVSSLTFFLSPWAEGKRDALKKNLENKEDVSMLPSGVFFGSKDGNRVFYVESIDSVHKKLKGVFVFSQERDGHSITSSAFGEQSGADRFGASFIELKNGRRHLVGKNGELEVMRFETYGIRLKSGADDNKPDALGARTTTELAQKALLGDAESAGELIWRTGNPIALVVLSILAVPLAYQGVRAKRSYSLAIALIVFFIYQNLLGFAQVAANNGDASLIIGLVAPHLPFIIAASALIIWQLGIFRPFKVARFNE